MPGEGGTRGPSLASHMRLVAWHLLSLRNALALAKVLGRTVVIPRLPCHCDRREAGGEAPLASAPGCFPCRPPTSKTAQQSRRRVVLCGETPVKTRPDCVRLCFPATHYRYWYPILPRCRAPGSELERPYYCALDQIVNVHRWDVRSPCSPPSSPQNAPSVALTTKAVCCFLFRSHRGPRKCDSNAFARKSTDRDEDSVPTTVVP